jgi:transposase-like protein
MIADSQVLAAIQRHGSQRKAAAALGLDRRTVERRLARMAQEVDAPRLLVIDIETAPNIAYVWGLFQQNVGINQIVEPGRVICFAAKWHGSDEMMFYSERQKGGRERMIRAAHRLMCEADGIVGWNSQRFDTRWLNAEFHDMGLRRPTGYRHVDLMRSQKRYQQRPSNKLDFAARHLGLGGKVSTGGFDLWRDCMAGDREAWRLMEEYNCADVELTDAIFADMLKGGWVANLPNRSVTSGEVCPTCGGDHLQADGHYQTQTRRYQRWVCQDCGSTSQSVKCVPGAARLKAIA